ncbi:MAG: rRNA maturation RNase YbeY [bacterium]|nr:rRNA maturation RNase YbeY [bacterium]
MALCLVSDRKMREYNREYRGKDATTDVLSFPDDGEPAPDGQRHLGDIVISVPEAARQAGERGETLQRELRVLSIHGYLHLLGYDHETDDGTMMRKQSTLVRSLLPRRAVRSEA